MPKLSTRFVAMSASLQLLVALLAACAHEINRPLPVANVRISPTDPFVVLADSVRMTASPLDENGNALIDRETQWSSSDTTKATVSHFGMVRGKALGSVEITATIEEKTATTAMRVVAQPAAIHVDSFFMVFSWPWPKAAYKSPIPIQIYDVSQCPENPNAPCLDDNAHLFRVQWNDVWDWKSVADWAANPRNRGHLYTVGDDLNAGSFGGIYQHNPKLYADDYCRFVRNVQKVDPTAEFTPTMIADAAADWWLNAFADSVLSTFNSGNCGQNPISEWTFNTYTAWDHGVAGFANYIGRHANWAVSLPAPLGKPLVVGAFVLGWYGDDVPNDHPEYVSRLREAKAWLFANPNIKMARYLLFEPWPEAPAQSDPHPLADAAGNLNASGRVYAAVTGRIVGPTTVRPEATCIWTAETTLGPPPYTYEWRVNTRKVGRRHWLVHANSGSRFVLQLRVTDANGGHGEATIDVSVTSSAPPCAP
jgi:hypothetical protein